MGKAMMGTGEASGDGRAMQAAEAAISNPLLDETSMKGARGLLVSVVGGKDLTLFEVDEATTRIREEVDDDANIIFGATFDDSLDGVIRVSVVATGIDQDPVGVMPEPKDTRVVSFADRAARKEASNGAPAALADPGEAAVAAVAAGLEDFDIDPDELEPVDEAPVFDEAALDDHDDLDDVDDAPQIAPEPQRPQRARPAAPSARDYDYRDGDERRSVGLLRRIANGLSRKEEDEEEGYEVEPRAPRRRPAQARLPAPAQEDRRRLPPPEDDDIYMDEMEEEAPRPRRARPKPDAARRPRGADHEPASRSRPAARSMDDDQLEIPAFLRRQAN
ncbi:MAG: cell division protein FtsZ, partial [Pseudomonadota bacterium]